MYDFDIVIDKFTGEGEDAKKLAGAQFVLKNSERKYYSCDENRNVMWVDNLEKALVVTTDVNGAARFTGLDTGTYYLQETEAPEGYNLLQEDVKVEITATYDADGTLQESSAASANNGQYSQTEKIENKAGAILPSTGGMGTTVFYGVGGVLIAAAVVLLITRKRMGAAR